MVKFTYQCGLDGNLKITCNPLQAWLKLVQMEREEAEKERKKEEEERRKKKEEAKRRSRILEAAFDGDNDEILAVLDEVKYHFSLHYGSLTWQEVENPFKELYDNRYMSPNNIINYF